MLYIEEGNQFNQKFQFNDQILMNMLNPSTLFESIEMHFPNLVDVCEKQVLDNEWQLLIDTHLCVSIPVGAFKNVGMLLKKSS